MTVYIIAEMKIHDRAEYDKYDAKFMDVFNQFEGELLSVDENPTVMEGEWSSTRSILIAFPSAEKATAWVGSDAYRAIAGHRTQASTGKARMVTAGVPEAFT